MTRRHLREEHGQTMTEYAVVLGLISVSLVLALTNIGTAIGAEITRAASALLG
jgi:Flp pilus assembly pilin Flp